MSGRPNVLVIWGDDIGIANLTIDQVMEKMTQAALTRQN
jgi:arylsulfatase A-like enzyme